jgi:hypothetical protein
MSDFLKIILRELSADINLIQKKKQEMNTKFDPESKTRVLDEMKIILKRGEDRMDKIEKEFRIVNQKVRNEFKTNVDSLKSELIKNRTDISKLELKLKKENLLVDSKEDSEEDMAKAKVNKVNRQNNNLDTVISMQKEIISTNNGTMISLVNQGQTIDRSIKKTQEIDSVLSLHDQVLGVMSNRELKNKLMQWIIVILLFIANLIILYIKLY